jgi:hypothetical protein
MGERGRVRGNPNTKIQMSNQSPNLQNGILKSKTLNLFQGKVQNDTLVMPK